MGLSVIIPAYNEAASIARAVERVTESPSVDQVLVVDDGSTDSTWEAMKKLVSPPKVRLLRHHTNRGKGAAVKTALPYVVGDLTIIQDADLEYDPADYPGLLQPMLSGTADIVYGSRYLNPKINHSGRWRFDCGVKILNLAVGLIYGVKITDEATCYKVFPTSLLRAMDLQCEHFEFCPEVTAKACRLGLRIKEVPIRYAPRSIEEGKKIRLRDGIQALWTLWKYRKWEGSWDRGVCDELSAVESQPATVAVRSR